MWKNMTRTGAVAAHDRPKAPGPPFERPHRGGLAGNRRQCRRQRRQYQYGRGLASDTTSHSTKKVTSSNYEINQTINEHGGPGRGIEADFARQCMLSPNGAGGQGADAKPKLRTPEEINQLKQIVQNALGMQDTSLITLEEMKFNPPVPSAMVQQMDSDSRELQSWLEPAAQKLIYPVLAAG